MKKFTLTASIMLLLTFYSQTAKADACHLQNLHVELNSSTPDGNGGCIINVNLTFDLESNNGNKSVYLHLWRDTQYPSLSYASAPTATDLSNALATIAFNNNTNTPALLTSYNPDNTVPIQSAGLTISKTTSLLAGYDRIAISNITLTIAAPCSNIATVKGDVWSTQSANGSSVSCFDKSFCFTVNDPIVNGILNCGSPRTYDVDITTTNPTTRQFTYKVYIDDGDHLLQEDGTDALIYTSSSFNLSSSQPFSALSQLYTYTEAQKGNSLWVVVKGSSVNACDYFTTLELNNTCPETPLTAKLAFFEVANKGNGNQLNWQTLSEQNLSRFEIEKSANGASFSKINSVATKTVTGLSSQIVDYNTIDHQPFATTFYRLKMVDRDGRVEYSNVVMVKSSKVNKITLFPNPSRGGVFTITGAKQSDFNSSLKVYNASGQQIGYTISNINASIGGATITLKAATRGIYMVEVNGSNGRQVERIYVE